MSDLPDVAVWVDEAGRPRAPGTIDRPVEQWDASLLELGGECVDIVDADGQHDAGPGGPRCDTGRVDEFGSGSAGEEVDEGLAEPEDDRFRVLEVDRQTEGP